MSDRVTPLSSADTTQQMQSDVIEGLSLDQKLIPTKYLYDEVGSILFDVICKLDDYDLTRVESQLLAQHANDVAHALGEGVRLVELGTGSGDKTRMLLDALRDPDSIVPIDISESALLAATDRLKADQPDLTVEPMVADFTQPMDLPDSGSTATRTAVYLSGSTLGNFAPSDRRDLYENVRRLADQDGAFLVAVDLLKAPAEHERAYNDRLGITSAFNLNLLARMNRELQSDFILEQFKFRGEFMERGGYIQSGLTSLVEQQVTVGDQTFDFVPGERLFTERSYKFDLKEFEQELSQAGMPVTRSWIAPTSRFALVLAELV